jgi:hypothetical protein
MSGLTGSLHRSFFFNCPEKRKRQQAKRKRQQALAMLASLFAE